MEKRKCKSCKDRKSIDRFEPFFDGSLGRRHVCRDCRSARAISILTIEAKERNRQTSRNRALRNHVRRYGISLEVYDQILRQQNGVCAICKRKDPSGRRLSIDHDHLSGQVRGLLCCMCNTAISLCEIDAEWGTKAAEYLANHCAIVPEPKLKAYTPEWKEKVRQGNIKTWSDPELRKKSRKFGRAGATKQWEKMSQEERDAKLSLLKDAAEKHRESMSEQEREKKIDELRAGRKLWWNSLPQEKKDSIAARVNRK